MANAGFRFNTTVRVRWMECDAQGIVFNGAYLGYLEVAQAEYFRNLGFSIYRIAQRGYFDSAVVKTTLEFKAPARVDDVLELHTRVARIGNTSLVLEMEIYRQDSDQPLSSIEAIYVGFHADTLRTRPVPDAIRTLVDHFEATGETLPLEGFPELHAAAR
jgi:acyl-CoA thioester hydrolase